LGPTQGHKGVTSVIQNELIMYALLAVDYIIVLINLFLQKKKNGKRELVG